MATLKKSIALSPGEIDLLRMALNRFEGAYTAVRRRRDRLSVRLARLATDDAAWVDDVPWESTNSLPRVDLGEVLKKRKENR